jgi:hypothetical protein
MRHSLLVIFSLLVVGVRTVVPVTSAHAASTSQSAPTSLSRAELEKLVQPIALYPDILLQQVLAASTFPDQALDAAMYNEQGKEPEGIKDQPWDDSVKGLANYPSVLVKLASDLDWTITLGSAFINQNEDLRNAIQTMRARAKTVGNLEDSEQQNVIEEKGANNTTIIRIEPAEPQVMYVPSTTTAAVYEKPVQNSSSWLVPLASFGVGMALGYAMGDDHDDHYYYGGGGFYGPGFWYGGAAVNNWVDYRRDRWDDAYDFARDREDWRQDNRDDWREYRQDLGRKQQEWRQERNVNGTTLTPEKRAEARSRASTARTSWQAKTPEQRQAANQRLEQARANGSLQQRAQSAVFDRQAASQRFDQARANGDLKQQAGSVDRGSIDRSAANQRMQQARSNPQIRQRAQSASSSFSQRPRSGESFSGGGLSGMSRGQSATNRASARGATSRASAGGGARGGGGGGRRR